MAFDSLWTDEEVSVGFELTSRMSAGKAAIIMTEQFGREITRSALIGKMNRMKNPNRTKKRVTITPKDYMAHRTKRWVVAPKVPSVKVASLPARYQPKWTCQYIGDVPGMCGKESHGPWCEEHKQIVTMRK